MKQRQLLDTSVLIQEWLTRRAGAKKPIRVADVQGWAKDLIALHETDAIVTPVYVEMIAGVKSAEELKLTRAFLGEFECLDEGYISAEDWQEAVRLAQRVPRDRRPRQLGDCLIRAVANRLRYRVVTLDTGFAS
jgi:predicted nucleic acid-binding protein